MGKQVMKVSKSLSLYAFKHLFHFVGRKVHEHRTAMRAGKRILSFT
jgi:hypothetical protein